MYTPLTEANVKDFIGKKIAFTAEGYRHNYRGIAIIKSVDMSLHNPLECDTLYGDDLSLAFLDDHGLETKDGGETYQLVNGGDKCFSYSDGYREVFIRVCE